VATDREAILALDIGTSETKAGLISPDGRLLATARRAYPIDYDPASGRSEQDPRSWWRAITEIAQELAQPIAAICCVGQGPTLVVVDAAGEPARPAITWMDTRSAEEANALEGAIGMSGWSLGILPAARWVERHDPSAAADARWYLNTWEWSALRMTDEAARTRSAGQQVIDADSAAAGGLAADRLPPVVEAGAFIGKLTAHAAGEMGLDPGIPVYAGTVDSFASFHGAGLVDPGDAVDTGGTSGGLAVYWDSDMEIPGTWVAPAPLADRWMLGGAMTSTGKALDWFAVDVLGHAGTAELVAEASVVPAGAGGLLFLPYLAGERSPVWDPEARGAFVGLTLEHGAPHLARAILEGAAFALRHVASPILSAGLTIRELRVTGGTATHEPWNQIKADVLGVRVAVPEVLEAALLGAGIMAATGIGWYPDVKTAIRSMVRMARHCEADPATRAKYDELFEAYVSLWPAIAPIAHRLGRPAEAARPSGW
jgi:xylulokinase